MPTYLTISCILRTDYSLRDREIARDCERRCNSDDDWIACARARERRSRWTCSCDTRTQLRNLHITCVGLCASVTLDRHTRAYVYLPYRRTDGTSNLVGGIPSRLESNIEFLKKIKDPIYLKNCWETKQDHYFSNTSLKLQLNWN